MKEVFTSEAAQILLRGNLNQRTANVENSPEYAEGFALGLRLAIELANEMVRQNSSLSGDEFVTAFCRQLEKHKSQEC